MHYPQTDPFFEQLQRYIQEGLDSAERGELVSADEVRAHFQARSLQLQQQEQSPQSRLRSR